MFLNIAILAYPVPVYKCVVMGSHDAVTVGSHDVVTVGSYGSNGQTLHRSVFIKDVLVLYLLSHSKL